MACRHTASSHSTRTVFGSSHGQVSALSRSAAVDLPSVCAKTQAPGSKHRPAGPFVQPGKRRQSRGLGGAPSESDSPIRFPAGPWTPPSPPPANFEMIFVQLSLWPSSRSSSGGTPPCASTPLGAVRYSAGLARRGSEGRCVRPPRGADRPEFAGATGLLPDRQACPTRRARPRIAGSAPSPPDPIESKQTNFCCSDFWLLRKCGKVMRNCRSLSPRHPKSEPFH